MIKFYLLLSSGVLFLVLFVGSCISEVEEKPVDCSLNPVVIEDARVVAASCQLADGAIEITASGGSGNYLYSTDSINFQGSSKLEGLTAGTYSVIVKDENDCVTSREVIVPSESGLLLEIFSISESGCETSNGSIELSADGGNPPYQYKVEGKNYQDSNVISGLASGDYTVYVKDSDGCEVVNEAIVTSGISYANSVSLLIENSCATTGCHDGDNTSIPDLTDFDVIQDKAERINIRTENKTMPPNGGLSDEEIAAIACWVDDGALNN